MRLFEIELGIKCLVMSLAARRNRFFARGNKPRPIKETAELFDRRSDKDSIKSLSQHTRKSTLELTYWVKTDATSFDAFISGAKMDWFGD